MKAELHHYAASTCLSPYRYVTHENSHVFELELSGIDVHGRAITETLCPTDVHKLYSVVPSAEIQTLERR